MTPSLLGDALEAARALCYEPWPQDHEDALLAMRRQWRAGLQLVWEVEAAKHAREAASPLLDYLRAAFDAWPSRLEQAFPALYGDQGHLDPLLEVAQIRKVAGRSWIARLVQPEEAQPLCASLLWGLDLSATGLDLEDADPLLQAEGLGACGLRWLDLSGNMLGEEVWAALAQSSALPKLQGLRLVDARLGPRGVEALADAPWLEGLRGLALGQNQLGTAGVKRLAALPFGALRSLELPREMIAGAARALAESPSLSTLVSLDLLGNSVGSQAIEALGKAPWRLRHLNLDLNDIGVAGARSLARCAELSSLRALHLMSNQLGAPGLRALCESEPLAGLRDLDLSLNHLGKASLQELRSAAFAPKLRRLFLDSARFEAGDLAELASCDFPCLAHLSLGGSVAPYSLAPLLEAAWLPALEGLSLQFCELDTPTLGALARAASGLQRLNLSHAKLEGPEAVDALAPLARQLRELDLSATALGPGGARRLAERSHPALRVLRLDEDRLAAEGAKHLAKLDAPSLRVLSLDDNRVGVQGVGALLQASWMGHLDELSLRGGRIKDKGAQLLAQHAALPHMRVLRLSENSLTDEGAHALEGAPLLWALEVLEMHGNDQAEALGALREASFLRGVRLISSAF
jgi:Ran GTPase-activating protein (RanGAP) involved in mRNA processing and transport